MPAHGRLACTSSDLMIDPCDGSVSSLANSANQTVVYDITNDGTFPAFLQLGCSYTAPVTSCSVPSEVDVEAGNNGEVTLTYSTGSSGTGSVTISAQDTYSLGNHEEVDATTTVTVLAPTYTVVVTPDGQAVSADANSTSNSQTFTVQDNGTGDATYTLTCSNTMGTCSLPGGASVSVTKNGGTKSVSVTYQTGAAGTTGTVQLTATYSTYSDAGSVTVTTYSHTVAVTPDNGTQTVQANSSSSTSFTIKNTGTGSSSYGLTPSCSGTASGCTVSPTSVSLGAGASTSGTVSYTAGADGTTGSVQLTARYSSTVSDAGSVSITPQATCQGTEASLSPCTKDLGTVLTNTTGMSGSVTITNLTGTRLTYTVSCRPTGAVASCSASSGPGLDATNQSAPITVTANAGPSDGDGTAHVVATTGTGEQVAASFTLEVLSPTSVVVSTNTTTTHVDGGASGSHAFTVKNVGHLSETFRLDPVCAGAVTQCTPSASQVMLGAGASTNVSVSYVASVSGGAGTVGLAATHIRSAAVTDTATAPVTEDRVAPVVALTPYNGDSYDPAGCVASCFAATASYTTPIYTSLDVARAVTLVYSSTTAAPQPVVQADVVDPSGIQSGQFSLQLRDTNAVLQHFANNSQEMFFTNSHQLRRLAVQFDTVPLVTGAHPYTLVVTSSWDTTTHKETDLPIRVLVDNERASPYGAGWSIAGLQHLTVVGDSVLITDGTGAMAFFRQQACPSDCSYLSPPGDFSTLVKLATPDSLGTIYERRYPDGTTVGFISLGRMQTVTDRFGTRTFYGYQTGSTTLARITDPVGRVTTLYYDAAGKLDSIVDPMGRTTHITISAAGDLKQIQDAAGGYPLRAIYDERHRLDTLINRVGDTTAFAYDDASQLASMTLPTITVNGQPARPVVQYGSLATAVLPATGTGTTANPAPGVDTSTIRASVTDPRGNVMRYAVNRFGEATRIEEPLGRVTTMTYDPEGHLTATTAPSGHTMGYRWSGPDVIQTTDSTTGQTVHISYESTYHEVAAISGDATPVTNYWSAGKLDSALVGGSMSHFTYDSATGRLLTSTDPLAHETSISYATSGLRNRISVTAAGRTTSFTPDAYGRVVTTTAPNGGVVTTVYDPINRVQQVVGPLPDTTAYTYGDSLHLTKVRDAKHQTYSSTFNALGWVQSTEDPTHHIATVAYDLAGNAVQTNDPAGHVVTMHYNALNQADTVTADGQKTTYSTDSLGRFVATSNAASTDTIFFDVAGRPISEVTVRDSERYVRSSTYDSLGLRTALTISASQISAPWSATIRYHYDPVAHQLDTLTDVAGGKTILGYNPDRLADTVRLPTSTGLTVSTTYPSTHTPSQVSYSVSALDSALGASYSYTPNELLSQRIPTHQAGDGSVAGREFQYDSLGRLVGYDDYHLDPDGWQDVCGTGHRVDADGNPCLIPAPGAKTTTNIHTLPYDKVGNRTDSGAVTDSANRLLQFGDNVLTYDPDGNLIERSRATDGFDQTYGWNSLGQLISVTTNGATVSFTYDGFGRRVSKATASDTTTYLYDGDDLLAEMDGAGNRVAEYTYYPGVDQPLSVRRWTGGVPSTYYYATDLPNNVVGLVNSSNTLVEHYGYTPFGTLEDSSGTVPNNLRFGAREFDAETGLYYNRARYYDPTLGRFISEDPIGLAGGINLFTYAGDDPMNATDPSGLCIDPRGYVDAEGIVHSPCPDKGMIIWGHNDGSDPISGLRIDPGHMIGGPIGTDGGGTSNNGAGFQPRLTLTSECAEEAASLVLTVAMDLTAGREVIDGYKLGLKALQYEARAMNPLRFIAEGFSRSNYRAITKLESVAGGYTIASLNGVGKHIGGLVDDHHDYASNVG